MQNIRRTRAQESQRVEIERGRRAICSNAACLCRRCNSSLCPYIATIFKAFILQCIVNVLSGFSIECASSNRGMRHRKVQSRTPDDQRASRRGTQRPSLLFARLGGILRLRTNHMKPCGAKWGRHPAAMMGGSVSVGCPNDMLRATARLVAGCRSQPLICLAPCSVGH